MKEKVICSNRMPLFSYLRPYPGWLARFNFGRHPLIRLKFLYKTIWIMAFAIYRFLIMRFFVFVCCTAVLALKCIVVLGQAPAGCTDQQVYVFPFML